MSYSGVYSGTAVLESPASVLCERPSWAEWPQPDTIRTLRLLAASLRLAAEPLQSVSHDARVIRLLCDAPFHLSTKPLLRFLRFAMFSFEIIFQKEPRALSDDGMKAMLADVIRSAVHAL
jgi:hypothetical protein